MKKLLLWLALPFLFIGCTADLESRIDGIEDRLSKLETLCSQLNTNISSLQTIVTALQKNDYVTSVTPLLQGGEEVGYTISFSKNKSITIYHGKNGADGKDGQTPIIGVKKDSDGQYYWTLNGDWLLDNNGKKVPASSAAGASGASGENGITPLLKIESDYWYVSYDEGKTWSRLGKATGENGDSFFKSVDTSSPSYIKFTLADGTTITVPRYFALDITLNLEGNKLELSNGQTVEIGYTLVNASENVKVTASSDGSYKLNVIKTNASSGKIAITAGNISASGLVNIFVVDNGFTVVKIIEVSNSGPSSSGIEASGSVEDIKNE